jgi:hypothetical protein
MEDQEEIPLPGGNVTAGVVRVGDTVRRPAGPWTPAVHALLVHLHDVGYDGSPRSLGLDERGRHVVEWVEGDVTHPYVPGPGSPSLAGVGRILRRLHDATEGFVPPPDAVWGTVMVPDGSDLVIHHDPGAFNFVHGAGRAVLIDWDGAGPGSRLWDLSWAAISFASLVPGAPVPVAEAGRRLRALADGYGLDEAQRRALVPLLTGRAGAMAMLLRVGRAEGRQPWARLAEAGHLLSWDAITEHVHAHRDVWERALLA